MFRGVLYIVNDNVVVTLDNIDETPWKAKIKGFIYHRTNDTISVHFAAYYYRHCQSYVRIDGRYKRYLCSRR